MTPILEAQAAEQKQVSGFIRYKNSLFVSSMLLPIPSGALTLYFLV